MALPSFPTSSIPIPLSIIPSIPSIPSIYSLHLFLPYHSLSLPYLRSKSEAILSLFSIEVGFHETLHLENFKPLLKFLGVKASRGATVVRDPGRVTPSDQ